MTTPLHPIDQESVAAFWDEHRRGAPIGNEFALTASFQFGDHADLADELLSLVLSGTKRATASALELLAADAVAVPAVGDHWVACDGRALTFHADVPVVFERFDVVASRT